MNPELEELYRKKAEAEVKVEQLMHEGQRLENRIRYYQEGQRKARNHRLIVRGATVESIWPEIKPMSKEDFDRLMRKVLTLPAARDALGEFLRDSG